MLAGLKEVIGEGRKKNMAIGSFNTPDLECLIAVLESAEELNLPVIIAHAQCHENIAGLDNIGPCMLALAERSKVKVCVHLDHGEDFQYCKRAIDMGFTSVMTDCSAMDYEDNIEGTKEVADYAHGHNVDVEAELGRLPRREDGGQIAAGKDENMYTDPDLVPDYIRRTGIDALAVAFGTAHGLYNVKPVLNVDIIRRIRKLTDIPLVMHGGSGISHDEYRRVIKAGIDKINYYSYMSYAGYDAACRTVERKKSDFYHNLAFNAQNAMKNIVTETLKVFSNPE